MHTPIDLLGFTSEVIFPSSIFSLERHENLPYERFAFNVFREAVNQLDEHVLPIALVIEFPPSSVECPGWAINCSVRAKETSTRNAKIVIQAPELLPTLLFMFSFCIGRKLFSTEGREHYLKDPSHFRDNIQRFFDSASVVVRTYRSNGQASAIRAGYEFLGIDFDTVEEVIDHFDALSYLIANHEIAHIHVGQFLTNTTELNEVQKAYEIIADLVATEWLFRRYVFLTPDTESYREKRNFESHAEAVWANAKWAIDTQLSLLILMGVAGAQSSDGRFHFEGGMRHPGSYGRYWLQQAWLFGAIEGQFSDLLGNKAHKELMKIWKEYFSIICESGIISRQSLWQVVDEEDVQIITRVADIAEANKIEELILGIHFLRSQEKKAKEMRSRMVFVDDLKSF